MSDNKPDMEEQSGDPGRTPGSAEGDRETVEEDLQEKNLDTENNESTSQRNGDESGASGIRN